MDRSKPVSFSLGRVVATPGALAALEHAGVTANELVRRHLSGDWGDLNPADAQANEKALLDGSRLFSSYRLSTEEKIWVITEPVDDSGTRSVTSLILPDEY